MGRFHPHLTALFRDRDAPVKKSDMSFAVSLETARPGCDRHPFRGAIRSACARGRRVPGLVWSGG
jgi:hypothetical protein